MGSFQEELVLADWFYRKKRDLIDKRIKDRLHAEYREEASPVIDKAIAQLREYFEGERQEFDLPLGLVGSPFQVKVWNYLITIPFGTVVSYKKQSQDMDFVTGLRAIASANGANALSIIVPCHRVVGSDGALTGYAGGLRVKEKLLHREGVREESKQLNLFNS